MLYTEGNRISVNEVYMGRTPEIQKLFSGWCKVRDKAIRRKSIPSASDISIIERGIAKIFGFKSAYISFEISNEINAFTMPVTSSLFINTDKIIHTTKNGGYAFDKSAGVVLSIWLTTGLYLNDGITNEEAFAILLHEIGHSFNIRSSHMGELLLINNVVNMVKIIFDAISKVIISNITPIKYNTSDIAIDMATNVLSSQSNAFKKLNIDISKKLRTNPIIRLLVCGSQLFNYAINLILEPVLYLLTRGVLVGSIVPIKISTIIINGILKLIGGNPFTAIEYLPDDFATTYGFGAAMDSAAHKLGNWDFANKNKLRSKIPVIKKLNKFLDTMVLECIQCLDIHPSSQKRSYQIRKNLLAELDSNKDLDPRLKKDIKEQIMQICKECDDIDASAKVLLDNKDDAVILMREILKETGGDYEAGDLVDKYIGMEGIDKDFENRLID